MNRISMVLLIIGSMIALMIIIFVVGQLGKPTEYHIKKAIEQADLSVCDDILFFRYQVENVPDIFGSHSKIYNSRDYCKREAKVIHPRSSGFYRLDSEEDMKKYYAAVRNEDPAPCLLMESKAGTAYCFEALQESSKNPRVCDAFGGYMISSENVYPEIFSHAAAYYKQQCQAEMMIRGNLPLETCQIYSGNEKAFCYLLLRQAFNQYVLFQIHLGNQPKFNALNIDDIPNPCEKLDKKVWLSKFGWYARDACQAVYNVT